MMIPAMAPLERGRVVGAGGWVVDTGSGEIRSPVNPSASKASLDCCLVNIEKDRLYANKF